MKKIFLITLLVLLFGQSSQNLFAVSLRKKLKRSKISYRVYRKKYREDITTIANKFKVNLGAIVSLNRIKSFLDFKRRRRLYIPKKSGLYFVKRKKVIHKPYHYKKYWSSKFSGVLISRKSIKGGKVSSDYGYRVHPITRRKHFHSGIDYASPKNSPLYIDFPSKVVYRGYLGHYGKTIILKSGRYKIFLSHLSRYFVRKGQRIRKKTLVGLIGKTGRATGYHVHYELRFLNKHIDPLVFVKNYQRSLALKRSKKDKVITLTLHMNKPKK